MASALYWLRRDLRLSDNPALAAAIRTGLPVVPVFIWAPEEEGDWAPGGAHRSWLHHALKDLDAQLRDRGSRLILRTGPTEETLEALIAETGARALFWNRRYEPAITRRDGHLKSRFGGDGLEVKSFNGALFYEPWEIAKDDGSPYKVYTPYSKAVFARGLPEAVPVPLDAWASPEAWPESLPLDALKLKPDIPWDAAFYAQHWDPTRAGAEARWQAFFPDALNAYNDSRNRPDLGDATSRLSPYLHWGQVSPRELAAWMGTPQRSKGAFVYHKELLWREFSYHILYHFPETPDTPLRPEFEDFPWTRREDWLKAWRRGRTGYPIVDAGMRELWETGWMHNRVRMVVASFLVKHLLQPWQEGARWFWDCLVDGDLANNTQGWQWSAGCGADAAPYFRVFNPILQGKKFDPEGTYVRRWVPELKDLPLGDLHAPWEADAATLEEAGITLGDTYPQPLVEHREGRERALAAFENLKKSA